MAKKTPIVVPPVEHPRSSLDGVSMTGIDTDPATNVQMSLAGLLAAGDMVLAVVPFTTRDGRAASLIVSQEQKL